jgi:hypothetical protein
MIAASSWERDHIGQWLVGRSSQVTLRSSAGYCDQTHLNRDFRELAGTTLTAFVRSRFASGGVAA